jgi:anti-sigma regulatory factor (Ser/Thr protein kinase)
MPSRRDEIAPAVERILELAIPVGLDRERRQDLAVATAEALANAAVHGNHLERDKWVEVRVEVTKGAEVSVTVTDAGKGFDTVALADPTDVPNLLVPRGRGVFLMRRLVDELSFNPAGNSVRLTLRARRAG